jgi:RNA polymerase sigma factor (TIGR02999 family)
MNISIENRFADSAYDKLRKIAQLMVKRERSCTLSATGLVHEFYLTLWKQKSETEESSDELPPYAARIMKQLLISRARRRLTRQKSESKADLKSSDDDAQLRHENRVRMIEVDDAISLLAVSLPENAELVRLHLYGDLSIEEAGLTLGLGRATAYRKWAFSKAWLCEKIGQ